MDQLDYWEECLSDAAETCDLYLSSDQLKCLATSVQIGQEMYSTAFYSPPAADRLSSAEAEWKQKFDRLKQEFDTYRNNAETAVRRALRQFDDTSVSIGDNGEVLRHGGRTEVIQNG